MITRKITYINKQDPVSAPTINRPLRQLKQETDELQSKFETTEAGNTLVYRDIPCDTSVRVGMPVYWDVENQCCKPAYLNAELNDITQEYLTGTPADCLGLVYRKNSSYSADILISGIVDFPAIADYLDGNTGRFYLSSTPGSLSCVASSHAFPLGIAIGPMGPCDTAYRVYFNPSYTNTVLQHQHFKVDLVPALVTNKITAGWRLPDENEEVPDGTKLVYNCEADENLSKVWPPVPIEAVSFTADWASEETVGGKELTVNKKSSLVFSDDRGIYWMSDTYLPYKTETSTDPYKEYRITVNFSKVRYSNRNNFVTSLQPATYQPFQFVDCKGHDANTGDLYAKFTLNENFVDSTEYDGYSLKRFTNKWESERVATVNAIRVTGNVTVEGTRTITIDGDEYHAGAVNVDVSPFAPDTEISPQIIKVGAAQEREIYNITYIGLPASRSSSLRLKFEIPSNYSVNGCTFKLRMQCIAAISGEYADATIKYIRVARANQGDVDLTNLTQQLLPDYSENLTKNVTAGTMFEVESGTIDVMPGDTIIVIISRESSSAYNADLAIARIHGVLNVR